MMVMTHDRAMVDEAHGSKNGNDEEDCDDNNCGVDQFSCLFLCPDPILSDSPSGTFDILRGGDNFGNSDSSEPRGLKGRVPPTPFMRLTPSPLLCPALSPQHWF